MPERRTLPPALLRGVLACLTGLAAAGITGRAQAKDLSFVAANGGIYEGVALSEDGNALALLRTDGGTEGAIDWAELDKDAKPRELFHLPTAPAPLETLVVLSPGAFAVVRHDEAAEGRSLTVFAKDGKAVWDASGLWQMGWPDQREPEKGAPPGAVTLVSKTAKGGWSVVARAATTGKAWGKARVWEPAADGRLPGSGLRPIAFTDGFSRLLTEKPGAYDKAKDVRQPSLAVILEATTGKVVAEKPIKDRYGWALTSQLRQGALRPGGALFLRIAEGGDPATPTFELVDAEGLIHPVTLPGSSRVYDRTSLVVDDTTPGKVTFSLLVDPVNADAVARKKADAPFLDVFELSTRELPAGRSPEPPPAGTPPTPVASLAAKRRAHVAVTDRPVVWTRKGETLAILTRFKSFARGGDRVDVLRLSP